MITVPFTELPRSIQRRYRSIDPKRCTCHRSAFGRFFVRIDGSQTTMYTLRNEWVARSTRIMVSK